MKYLFLGILFLSTSYLLAQTPIDWYQLSEVRYIRGLDIRTGYLVDRPRFSKKIKSLDGKQVEITGYILPIDAEGTTYVLSRNPYASCFFCGGGGLESVMDIRFTVKNQGFKLDQYVTLRGVLRLSESGDGLIYLLDEAVEVK